MSSSTPEAEALAHFQAGRFEAAEAAWRAILQRRPDQPDVLHLLGILLVRTGRAAEGFALRYFELSHNMCLPRRL